VASWSNLGRIADESERANIDATVSRWMLAPQWHGVESGALSPRSSQRPESQIGSGPHHSAGVTPRDRDGRFAASSG
jgi:hypothetical protein